MPSILPQGIDDSIPFNHLLFGIDLIKCAMDKSERRRKQLIALVEALGHGGIALVAGKIGKEASYVSRMLYDPTKPGKKRITEASADLLDLAFPGWLEDPVRAAVTQALANTDRANRNTLFNSSRPPLLQDSEATIQIKSPMDTALATLVQLVRSTDDLTRDQIKPLVNRMFDEPERAAEIAQRIGTTLQNASPAPKPHGLTALLANKTKKPPLEEDPPPDRPT